MLLVNGSLPQRHSWIRCLFGDAFSPGHCPQSDKLILNMVEHQSPRRNEGPSLVETETTGGKQRETGRRSLAQVGVSRQRSQAFECEPNAAIPICQSAKLNLPLQRSKLWKLVSSRLARSFGSLRVSMYILTISFRLSPPRLIRQGSDHHCKKLALY